MSIQQKYARQVRHAFGQGYHAAWYPDRDLKIGDYGRMEGGVFNSRGNLSDFGIHIDLDVDESASKLEINLSKHVSISVKAAGETNAFLPSVPKAEAGIALEFEREGAFAIAAENVFEDRLRNYAALEAQLEELKDSGQWDSRDFYIVTGVLRMPVATIIIAQEKKTKVEISLEGTVTPAIPELGKASVTPSFLFESSATVKYAPARDATPIIQLHRFKGTPFGPPRLRDFSRSADLGGARTSASDPSAAQNEERWQLILADEVPLVLEE